MMCFLSLFTKEKFSICLLWQWILLQRKSVIFTDFLSRGLKKKSLTWILVSTYFIELCYSYCDTNYCINDFDTQRVNRDKIFSTLINIVDHTFCTLINIFDQMFSILINIINIYFSILLNIIDTFFLIDKYYSEICCLNYTLVIGVSCKIPYND